jgi:hypothetical protein
VKRFLAVLSCSVFFAIPAWCQFELGSVVGLVTDPQKAPVVGASVQIRSLTTNVRRDVTTSASGEYNSLPLQPGRYAITVHQPGFRDASVELTLGVSQRLQADISWS